MSYIRQYLAFIQEAEQLKNVLRSAHTSEGKKESTAEHSWRLTLLIAVAAAEYPHLDSRRMLLMGLIHDLGELYDGDIPAVYQTDDSEKFRQESAAVSKVFALLPDGQRAEYIGLWHEYAACETPEAKLVKALDKAETIIQHNQGENPADFDYAFNLNYGKEYFEDDELLRELRTIIDQDTKDHLM